MDKLILKSTTLLAGVLISSPMIITTASAATTGGDYTSSGNLTVDYGSTLYFGTQSISTKSKTYYAHPDMVKDQSNAVKVVPNYAQVTDQSGELSGWTLSLT